MKFKKIILLIFVLFLFIMVLDIISIIYAIQYLNGAITLFLLLLSVIIGILILINIKSISKKVLQEQINKIRNVEIFNFNIWELFIPIKYIIIAILFIFPGFVSDIVALILITPLLTNIYKRKNKNNSNNNHKDTNGVIDVNYTEIKK